MFFDVAGYQGLYEVLLFELRMRACGLCLRAGRPEERERVARESARSAWSDSGALGVSVRYDGHS